MELSLPRTSLACSYGFKYDSPPPPAPPESLETMRGALGKLFCYAKWAVPGEPFSVMVPR